jgi:surface antigen
MAGPVARRRFWLTPYNGTAVASLRLAAALALAFGVGGCAAPGGLGSMFTRQSHNEARSYANEDVTGSVGVPAGTPAAAATSAPSETDLIFARMAIVEVLKRGSKELSAPWENPSSGARGTVTPIASAYNKDGTVCRDFLASYVRRQGPETWLQGEACRAKLGVWEVKNMRPWTRS